MKRNALRTTILFAALACLALSPRAQDGRPPERDPGEVELVFTGSVLREEALAILFAPESPDASLPKSNFAASAGGRFRAFTVNDPKRTHGHVDRIFFEDASAGRTFEMRNLENPHRPFDDLKFFGAVLQFDRWAGPHTGIRYRVDLRRRRLVSARAFVEADYVRLLKKSGERLRK